MNNERPPEQAPGQPRDAESAPASIVSPRPVVADVRAAFAGTAAVQPYAWMILGSFALASMGALAHRLRGSCDWQVIVLARGCLQLLLAGTWACLAGVSLVFWKPWILWVRSIAGSLGMVCMFYAYTRLPVAEALTLNNLFPIWVALLSWPLLKQAPSPATWLAVVSATAGVFLMQQPGLAERNLASLAALASSLCTAIAMIALNRLKRIDVRAIVVHFSGVAILTCAVCYFPWLMLGEPNVVVPAAMVGNAGQTDGIALVTFLLLGVGVLAVVAQLGITKAFTTGNAVKTSVVNLTQVAFAMIFDAFCFGHRLDPVRLLGMALILVPTIWLLLDRSRGPDLLLKQPSSHGENHDGTRS